MAATAVSSFTAGSTWSKEMFTGTYILCISAGSILAGTLYNASSHYYTRAASDFMWHRAIVAALLVVSAIALGSSIGLLWDSFAAHGGTFAGEDGPNFQFTAAYVRILFATPVFSGVLSQIFFGIRAWRAAGRRWWLGGMFFVLTAVHFALGLTAIADPTGWSANFEGMPNSAVQGISDAYMGYAVGVSALNDLVLTAVLAWTLASRRRGFNSRTDALLSRISNAAITTGAISTVLATFTAILTLVTAFACAWFISEPHGRSNLLGLPNGLLFVLPQLYPLLVVGTLNLRFSLQSSAGGVATPYDQDGKALPGGSSSKNGPSGDKLMDSQSMSRSMPVAPSAKYQGTGWPEEPPPLSPAHMTSPRPGTGDSMA